MFFMSLTNQKTELEIASENIADYYNTCMLLTANKERCNPLFYMKK